MTDCTTELTLEELAKYTNTENQKNLLLGWAKYGSQTEAIANGIGTNKKSFFRAKQRALKNAAAQGYAPHRDLTHPTAPGFGLKRVSTAYKDDGSIGLQWVIQEPDKLEKLEALRNAVEDLASDIKRYEPLPAPKSCLSDLCNVYTLTDCHIGMMAWRKEGGDDWDTKIAEDVLIGCFGAMVDAAPAAKTCVIAQLGDFLHWDGLLPVTPSSGHILDADGRFGKMVEVAIRVLRAVVDMALTKHERVVLVPAEGNHDMASSVWLRKMFAALYENEPRLHVIDSELPYYAHQHGETALFWHHSHLKKHEQLPLMMAAQFPEIWGATKRRFCHTGDKHHTDEKEYSGCIVLQHPTLAARDAYASRHGWHALRRSTAITYSRKHGEVARNTVCPEMLG